MSRLSFLSLSQLVVATAYALIALADPAEQRLLYVAMWSLGLCWAVSHTLMWGAFPQVVPKGALALGAGLMGAALNIGPTLVPLLVSLLAAPASGGDGGGGASGAGGGIVGGGNALRARNPTNEMAAMERGVLALAVLAVCAAVSFGVQITLERLRKPVALGGHGDGALDDVQLEPGAGTHPPPASSSKRAAAYAHLPESGRTEDDGGTAECPPL